MDLEGKVIFVTGSSSGIGEQMVYAFSKEKAKVVITYFNNADEAEKVAEECKKLGAEDVLMVQLDVKDDQSIKNAISDIIQKFPVIDILINNAGVISWKKFRDLNLDLIENQTRTNLEGLIKTTFIALPHIKQAIIGVSSGAGQKAHPGLSVYCATKFGVRGFIQTLAIEYPELKIFSLCPDTTATEMTNFQGTDPAFVAALLVRALKGEIQIPQGGDLNVWEFK